jgi:hypothetical protein
MRGKQEEYILNEFTVIKTGSGKGIITTNLFDVNVS